MIDPALSPSSPSRQPGSATEVWFAPMVGLRRGNRWVGVIGLELQPGTKHQAQHPAWSILVWERTAADGAALPGIREAFDDMFRPPGNPLLDRLRYPGRWIPTTGENATTGFNYGDVYDASQVTSLGGFDQIVPLSWSFGQAPADGLLSEASIVLAEPGRAVLAQSRDRVDLAGKIFTPVGLPEASPAGAGGMTSDLAVALARVYPPTDEGDDAFRYAKFTVSSGRPDLGRGTLLCKHDWNGYAGTQPFGGVARLDFNSKLCPGRTANLPGVGSRAVAGTSDIIKWRDFPDGPEGKYKLELAGQFPAIDTANGTPETDVRAYALLNHISLSDGTGVTQDVLWNLEGFAAWFAQDDPPQDLVAPRGMPATPHFTWTITARIVPDQIKPFLAGCGRDVQQVTRDGSVGDSASFFPAIATPPPDRTHTFQYRDGIIKLLTPLTEHHDTASILFPRFGAYEAGGCASIPLAVDLQIACLPHFMGWHGLDLEIFVRQSTVRSDVRRSEGSLSVDFLTGAAQAQLQDARMRLGARKLHGCERATQREPAFHITALQLPVRAVVPFTRDLLPPDRLSSIDEDELSDFDESPILIPLLPPDPNPALPLLLEVNEACEPPRARNLRAELMRQPSDRSRFMASRGFLVIDRTPFLVAKVELPPLARNDGFNSSVVARRVIDLESGQPIWEFALDTTAPDQSVHVTLPAQATGEEALLKDKERSNDQTTDPHNAFFAYRFGAPTRLDLASTYNAQRYAPAPWNLRRFFGYAGQRDPGAAVTRLEFELLYGLYGVFSGEKTDVPVRIAELFARLGTLPGGVPIELPWLTADDAPEPGDFRKLREQWRSVVGRFATRLGVLQPWSATRPAGLVLTDGLQYAPRVRVPLDEQGRPGAPVGAQLYLPDDYLKKLPPGLQALHRKTPLEGLPGGFHWGMQEWDAPFYQLFWDNRKSSSAEARDLGFSTLGGWGHQMARFAGDRLLIQSRVAMGRTHVYTVERIGRIGVFWHKAKHVIRYERSVTRSKYGVDWQQDKRYDGRPILRKMEEYIELIEDRKDYPDHPNGQPLDTGLVQACYFPGKGSRIPISHAWGRSLDNGMAWEVPLWRANADPNLYPKPEIFVEMSSGAGADARPVAQTIANPQDVYFYTTAAPGLIDDVNKWPVVAGTDFLNAEEPTEWRPGANLPHGGEVPDAGWPGAVAVPPGYERFTFQLDASQDEINLVANRREDVMLHGRVRNVTMMRSTPHPVPPPAAESDSPAKKNASRLRDWQRQGGLGFNELRSALTNDFANAGTNLATLLVPVRTRLPKFVATGFPAGPITCASSNNPILARLIGVAISEVRSVILDRGRALVTEVLDPITKQVNTAAANLASFDFDGWKNEMTRRIDEAMAALKGVSLFIDLGPESILDALDQQLAHQLADPFDRLSQMIDLCGGELEAIASGAEAFVKAHAGQATARLDELTARINTIRDRVTGLILDFDNTVRGLPAGEPWDAVKTDICGVGAHGSAAGGVVPPVLSAVTECAQALTDRIATLKGASANWADSSAALAQAFRMAATEAAQKAHEQLDVVSRAILRIRQIPRGHVENCAAFTNAQGVLSSWVHTCETELDGTLRPAILNAFAAEQNPQILLGPSGLVATQVAAFRAGLDQAVVSAADTVGTTLKNLFCPLADLTIGLPDVVADGLDAVDQIPAIAAGIDTLRRLDYTDSANRQKALDELTAMEQRLGVESSWIGRQLMPALQTTGAALDAAQAGSDVLRSVRVLSQDLRTDGLGFNRKTVALLLNHGLPTIDLTPTLTRLNQFGDRLGALGLRIPTSELAERFLPNKDWLKQFDFNRIISDCGGAKLAGLLKACRLPDDLADKIHVTHGFDKRTLRAWVQADIDVELAGHANLFDFGPVTVSLNEAHFTAHVHAEADATGRFTKEASGAIAADWVMSLSDSELVTFKSTQLTFQDGRMHFDLNPKNIELGGLLQILSDVTSLLPSPQGGDDEDDDDEDGEDAEGGGGGFKITLLQETVDGYEVPAGVRAALELPKFGVGATPVVLTGVQLGGLMELRALRKVGGALDFDFSLALGFHVSRKELPFNMAIFCLGGGGWIETHLTYRPLKSELTADITVGMTASASLAFDIGFLSGGVGIYFGLFVEYQYRTGSPSTLGIGFLIVVNGNLDLLGIVTVSLVLLLQAEYKVSGDQKWLECTGLVSVSIKICWCFTLSVSCGFTYRMGQGNSTKSLAALPAASDYTAAADEYLDMYSPNPV